MVLRICKSFAIILISPYSVYVVSEILCTVTGYSYQGANHVPLVARVILLERVICFLCLSVYRHQPIPTLHIPCTAWNTTFISMICHFRCCPRLFIYNTCRTSDVSAGDCLEQGQVYGMMGRSDPDCCITVGVMFWFACFSVVFFNHEIYIRRKLWCLRITVCHFHVQNCYYITKPR